MPLNPRILLAFSNDGFQPDRELKALKREMKKLDEILQGQMEVTDKWEATQSVIVKALKELGEDIRIFHFAGHAGPEGVETQEGEAERRLTRAQGLADFIGLLEQVHLVFLNGCATQQQVALFHRSQVPVVIATTEPVGDVFASDFAIAFYDSLAKGRSIQKAFAEAQAQMGMNYDLGGDRALLSRREPQAAERDFPYRLHCNPQFPDAEQAKIADWVRETPTSGPLELPPSSLSESLYLTCDRDKQNNDFIYSLEQGAGPAAKGPHFFIIHGERPDLPNSLAERFYEFSVREIFSQEGKSLTEEKFDLHRIDLPSPDTFESGDPKRAFYFFQHNFHRSALGKPQDATELLPQLSGLRQVVLFQHSYVGEHWRPGLGPFLHSYLHEFWKVTPEKRDPTLIVLFDFTYARKSKGLKGLFSKNPNTALEKALRELADSHPNCHLLERLPLVSEGDVERWKNACLPSESQLTDKICRGKSELPMIEVQPQLRDFIKLHNSRYG
jgi:hypothetical protein